MMLRIQICNSLAGAFVLLGASVSLAGCAQLQDRFSLFAPISPETAGARGSNAGSYRDEYGVVHSYSDQAGSDRPISDYLTPKALSGSIQ
jgi:hypothetical protein